MLVGIGCGTDDPADVGTNNDEPNNMTTNNMTTANNATANNMTTVNNMSTGNNANNVTTPPTNPFPTTFALTNGGGSAESSNHKIQLTIGSPQPFGQAEGANNKVIIGPIVPVTQQ